MKLSDLKGLKNKAELDFISAENVSADYWIVKLKPAKKITWIPGEHGIFTIPGKKFKGRKWRAFSVASSPDEEVVILGTRTGEMPSGFKKTLLAMKPGEKVKMRGPFGWYKLQKSAKQIVIAATGVGITPARALIMDLKRHHEVTAELIHAGKYHLFMEDLNRQANQLKNLKLHYASDRVDMAEKLNRIATKYCNNATYYLSGNIKAISSMKKILKKAGIKGRRIVNDPFFGY